MLISLIPAVLTAALIALLYRQGIAATKCITAVLFVFRPGKQSDRVSLNSCTGWVRHRLRFRQSRIYEFHLDCQLSKGDAEVLLLNGKKEELLRLDRHAATAVIALNGSTRYYLRWEFKAATGSCELRW